MEVPRLVSMAWLTAMAPTRCNRHDSCEFRHRKGAIECFAICQSDHSTMGWQLGKAVSKVKRATRTTQTSCDHSIHANASIEYLFACYKHLIRAQPNHRAVHDQHWFACWHWPLASDPSPALVCNASGCTRIARSLLVAAISLMWSHNEKNV